MRPFLKLQHWTNYGAAKKGRNKIKTHVISSKVHLSVLTILSFFLTRDQIFKNIIIVFVHCDERRTLYALHGSNV